MSYLDTNSTVIDKRILISNIRYCVLFEKVFRLLPLKTGGILAVYSSTAHRVPELADCWLDIGGCGSDFLPDISQRIIDAVALSPNTFKARENHAYIVGIHRGPTVYVAFYRPSDDRDPHDRVEAFLSSLLSIAADHRYSVAA